MGILDYAHRLGVDVNTIIKDAYSYLEEKELPRSPTNFEVGKAGYDAYLADPEVLAKLPKDGWEAFYFDRDTAINYERWSAAEKYTLGEIYATQGLAAAEEYISKLNDILRAEEKERDAKEIADWTNRNFWTKAAATAHSVGLNFIGGTTDYLYDTVDYARYLITGVRNEDGTMKSFTGSNLDFTEQANIMQGTISQGLNEEYGTIDDDVWLFGGKGWGDVYGLGTSIGQSALAGATSGYGIASMFGIGAANGVNDAYARGANPNEAMLYGTLAGLIEMVTEMISIKQITGIATSEGVETVFKSVLKTAASEAGEELASSVLSEVADRWILEGKSHYSLRVKELMASGMSAEEAEKQAWKETMESIAYDAVAGAASGGIMGAGAVGVNRINQKYVKSNVNSDFYNSIADPKGYSEGLIAEGKKYDLTKKRGTKLENKINSGKDLSGYDLRTYAAEVENAQRVEDVELTRRAVLKKMKEEGLTDSQAIKLGEIALNKAIGNDISKIQELMLWYNDTAIRVYEQMTKEAMASNSTDSDWIRNTPLERLREEKEAEKQNAEIKVNKKNPSEVDSKFIAKADERIVSRGDNINGSNENVYLRDGGKRYGSQNTEGQVSGMESRAGQAEIRRETSADSNAARLVNEGREVTASELGIEGGSTTKKVKIVDREKETASMKKARKAAEARGLKVEFFVGDNLSIVDKNGKEISARAYIKGNEVYVRADHPLYTAEQLMNHELGHDKIEKGEVDIEAVRKALEDKVGKENIDKVAQLYKEAYEGSGMTDEEIWAECICDSLGEMNVFAANEVASELIGKVIPEVSKAVDKSPTQTRGSPEEAKMSGKVSDANFSIEFANDIADNQRKFVSERVSRISAEELEKAISDTAKMVEAMKPYANILPQDKVGKTLVKNGSYDVSVENTTVCIRTLAYNSFVDMVSEKVGRPLTQMESFLVSQKLYEIAKEPQCLYCYVSLDRKAFNEMVIRYTEQRDTAIKAYEDAGKPKIPSKMDSEWTLFKDFLDGRKATTNMWDRYTGWLKAYTKGEKLVSLSDISTEARRAELVAKGGETASQVKDILKYAQSASWAKKQTQYVAYNDEILKLKLTVINNLNSHYGMRWYSFSDYSGAFIVENMQQITDAAIRGLKGLSYTKDTDFAEIFAPTGMNINISVYAKKTENGYEIDAKQSANIEEAIKLREQYPNVGIVVVATDNGGVEWALEQKWSDVVIPFHTVRTGADVAEFYNWEIFNAEQNDTVTDQNLWDAYLNDMGKKKASKMVYPNEHQNNRDKYLSICEKRGLTPRFKSFLDNANYMKLVNETRQSESQTSPLKAIFNLKAAERSFDKFVEKGGYYEGWYNDGIDVDGEAEIVANDVKAGKKANEVSYGRQDVDFDTVAKTRKTNRQHGKASRELDTTYLDAVNRGDMETAQKMVDEAAKAAGYTIKGYHATNAEFNEFDISKTSDINWHGKGIYFTNSQKDVENNYENYEAPDPWQKIESQAYELLYDKYGYSYEDTLDNDYDVINKLNECYDEVIDKFKNTVRRVTAYLKFDNPLVIGKHEQIRDYDMTQYDGIIDKHVSETIAQSGMDENTVHYIVLNPKHIKSAVAVTYDDNGNVIPLSERFNQNNTDIRYSRELPVDKYTLKEYNSSEMFTETNEFMQAVPYGSRAAFKRSLANQTSGLGDGEVKLITINAAGQVYFFAADGYMKGRVVSTTATNIHRLKERDDYANGTKSNRKDPNRWIKRVSNLRGESASNISVLESRRRSVSNDQISDDESRSIRTRDSERVRENSYTEEEIDRIVKQLKELYGLNEESKGIRYSRETVTSGQYEQMKANLSHSKVYTKKSAMELVTKIAPGIRARSFEALSNQLWEGLNSYTTIDDKRAFAEDMAEIFVDRMMVDTLVKHSEWDNAVERMSYLKAGINSLDFVSVDAAEVQHILDKKGKAQLVGRWGYKSNRDGSFKRHYGLDEFISDLSREMPGMDHLAEMHPVDALIEVDSLYTELSQQIKEKYESAYSEFSDEEMNEIKRMISYEIMNAYTELGEQTKISKYLSEKFEYYQSRIDFWKAENAKTKKVSRWHGIISTKALQIKDLKKGAFYNATQHHQDIFKDSIEKLANIQWRGNLKPTQRISEIFGDLKQWYTMENPMLYKKDADVNLYSEAIATYITKIADSNGAFDENTYAMVYDVMNHLYTMMRNYNKIFRDGRWQDAPDLVDKYIKIMEENKRSRNALLRAQQGYNTEFLEPMAIAKRADGYNPDGFFTKTMEDLRRASINASVGEMNLRKEYDAFIDKNKKYLVNAAKETVSYRGHNIPKLNLIGLYMTMKREHARAGLALNGFEYTIKNKWWDSADKVYVKGYVTDGDNVTQEMINEATFTEMRTIEESLNDTDKQYIEILEKLFNEDLKALKVERDMERQGFTNATLDYYYPIIRGAMAENIDTAKISDQNRATNASFNKNTVKGAKQRLVIISADAMVNRHITDMCKYYYMSQAIENYNVLYNCDVSGNANDPLNIAKIVSENKIWEKDVDYFKKLVKDMQGIRDPQTTAEKVIEYTRGAYASFTLGANVKVLFTQLSSMIAAGDVISFKSILSPKALSITTTDLDNYCPLAAVRNYDTMVLKAMTVSDKIGKFAKMFSWGIGKVDRLVVRRLFAACQVEAQRRGLGELGTEQNKIAAGKLLEEVIIETQQNSFATERSQAMRSKHELLKAFTMFTADGMKIVSRMHEAWGEMRAAKNSGDKVRLKKARKKFARSVGVAVNIAVYMTALAWLFNWIYDREEEEDENKALSFTLDTIGNFIGALPILSDLYDYIVNGYEVESVAFDTVNNLFSSINNIRKDLASIISGDGERSMEDINRDLRSLLYGVGQATGIPFRNIYNLARGAIGHFTKVGGYKLDSYFYETNLESDLEKAIEEGNNAKITYILSLIYDEKLDKAISSSQVDEVKRLTEKEFKVLPKDIPKEITRDDVTYTLTAEQKDAISTEYAKVVDAIDTLIETSYYKEMSDEDKAYMIDYYHDKYYAMAVNQALGFVDEKEAFYTALGFDTYAHLAYATKGIESDKDADGNTIAGSKKAKVIEAISKLSISYEEKLLYIASLGYALSAIDKKKLLTYLNSLKVSETIKEQLAKKCGFDYKNGKIVAKSKNKG